MLICEYCGRLHQVQVPDYRFCSTHCRQQQQIFLLDAGYSRDGKLTFVDYALTEADYLAQYLVTVAKLARQIVLQADAEEDDEDVISARKDSLIETLARGNSVAEKIYELTKPSLLMRGISPTI